MHSISLATASPRSCARKRSTARSAASFFFNDTATTETYTTVHPLSLHDALPISGVGLRRRRHLGEGREVQPADTEPQDRKSTRLNSSHGLLPRMPSPA